MTTKLTSNITELCDALGVHRSTFYTWRKQDWFPHPNAAGAYDVDQCKAAVDTHREQVKQARRERHGSDDLRERLTIEQTKRITGRTEGTRSKLKRARARLERSRSGHPRRELLAVLLDGLPELYRSAMTLPEPSGSNDPHPAVQEIVRIEKDAAKTIPALAEDAASNLKTKLEELIHG